MDFVLVLNKISSFFERTPFPYAVIGAFGLHAYGLSRATRDLDFVTEAGAQQELIDHLESLGYETLYRSAGYSNHFHADAALGRVDFVYVSGETGRRMFADARPLLHLGELVVSVPRPEHIAAMKIHAMKNDPERRFQELADLQFILGLDGIDEEEIRQYFDKRGLIHLYHELKRQV